MRKIFKAVLVWVLPLSFLGIFYFFPLGKIWSVSFARASGEGLTPLIDALRSDYVRRLLWFTIWQAGASTLLTLVLGLPGAYLLARFDFRGKSLLKAITGVPFVMPTLVVAASFNALLGPNGWINQTLIGLFNLTEPPIQFLYTIWAILLAHVFYNTTIVLRLVGDFWTHLDPQLGKAAQTMGANRWEALRHITLPLLAPAIAAAALLVFIFDFSSFAVVLILGGPKFSTLEVEIFYQTSGQFNLPLAASLSVLQLACTLGMTILYTRLSARISRPLEQRSRAHTQSRLDTKRKKLFASLIILVLLVFLVTPLGALASRSVTHLGTVSTQEGFIKHGFTLAFYKALTESRIRPGMIVPPTTAIAVSLGYAMITVIFSLILGLPAAWALTKNKNAPAQKILDPILMLPLGTSAVTLGLGFLVALNQPPLDLRASPVLIPLAHTLVAFPFVVRSLMPIIASIQPSLRQAAAMLGASPLKTWQFIDLPLIGRGVIVAATFAFTLSIGEFGATSLIARPEYPTIPVAIYRLLSRPGAINYGQGLALSTILMVVTTVGMLAIERFRTAAVGEF